MKHPIRTLILIWLAWCVIVIGYQAVADWRYSPQRPDQALSWTATETTRNSQKGKAYLTEPFMNRQVSFDSEFYLSIATVGYDDPLVHAPEMPDGSTVRMNYAFFPLYPMAIRVLNLPLSLFGLNPIATSTLSGVLVSMLGTLIGVIALFDITRDELDVEGGLRAAFYFLIFPTGFFLAQVFSEGLFVGLAFGSLALMSRKRLALAAILAVGATFARSVGAVLFVPLGIAWVQSLEWRTLRISWRNQKAQLLKGLLVLAPIGAYLIWNTAMGKQFVLIERYWFGREIFYWDGLKWGFKQITTAFAERNTQSMVYYALEGTSMLIALIASLVTLRRYPGLSLFGVISLAIILTSGAPQSLIRYALAVPVVFIALARWGRNPVFDRSWTMISLLLMGMLAALFAFDMWVA